MQPSLVEAEQLAALTRGMQQVRSIVRRETFGVVLPIKQLEVLDQIIATHEALVTRLRERAQSAYGGVVNLIDALVLLDALVGQVGAAADWLEIARSCPRLPRFNEKGPLLSTQKSEQRRGGVLAFIERYFGEATSLMTRLKALAESAPGSDPAAVELLLGGYEVQLNCLRALALTSATGAIKSAIDAPSFVHERLLGRLHTVFTPHHREQEYLIQIGVNAASGGKEVSPAQLGGQIRQTRPEVSLQRPEVRLLPTFWMHRLGTLEPHSLARP